MKTKIHPQLHPILFVDISTGAEFVSRSTMKSDRTKVIDGVEHYVVMCSVTSDSHPAYTGEQRLVDTAGRIEKFNQRYKNPATPASAVAVKKKGKK
jgi:large subunit ribosomal protein L31